MVRLKNSSTVLEKMLYEEFLQFDIFPFRSSKNFYSFNVIYRSGHNNLFQNNRRWQVMQKVITFTLTAVDIV